MKKQILWLSALFLPILGLLNSCSSDEDIVFDHEKAAFEIQADKILIEAIQPSTTTTEEDLYIVGAFNGLDDETVIGNEQYKLLPSKTIAQKRGIYLDPTTFVSGKTLADGYHFVSSTQRNEVTAVGDTVIRVESPNVGTRTNMYISKWAAYFDPAPGEVEHDGYVVYVDNQTSWGKDLTLYMWGDVNDLNAGWPGMAPTGTEVVNGVTYTYFDMGAANSGLSENLIFNNNGGGIQLADFAYVIDHDVYLKLTDSGVEEINHGGGSETDGYKLYINNQTGWAVSTMYAWGTSEIFGAWPGTKAVTTETVDGVEYQVWNIGNDGSSYNPIINDNGGGNQLDCPVAITADRNYYFTVTTTEWTEKQ